MDNKSNDLLKLNALVDGELAPAERAALAARLAEDRDLARAHATLAQLKATLAQSAEDTPAFVLPTAVRRTARWPFVAAAAALVVAVGFAWLAAEPFRADLKSVAAPQGPTAITLASLPADTTVPQLDTAGLKLIGLALDPGKVPLFVATYRGPHGCRLDLRAWPLGAEAPPLAGSSRHRWETGGLVYEMVAHGMPEWRFTIIAEAAEQQIRQADPARAERRLREANIGAPPCLG
jgi:anti-sigma factor RsiW